MTYFYAYIIVLLSAITQGTCGFGFGLISIPLLSIFFPVHDIIAAMLLHGTMLNIIVAIESRAHINVKRIWLLILFGVIGIPLGSYLLKILSGNAVSTGIGGFITFFSILLLLGYKKPIKNEHFAMPFVGFISGILNGLITMSGPPVVLFLSNQNEKKSAFRANLVIYFLILNIVTIPIFIRNDILTQSNAKLSLVLLPVLIIGTFSGMYIHRKINDNHFKKVAIIMTLIAGILSILKGLSLI